MSIIHLTYSTQHMIALCFFGIPSVTRNPSNTSLSPLGRYDTFSSKHLSHQIIFKKMFPLFKAHHKVLIGPPRSPVCRVNGEPTEAGLPRDRLHRSPLQPGSPCLDWCLTLQPTPSPLIRSSALQTQWERVTAFPFQVRHTLLSNSSLCL